MTTEHAIHPKYTQERGAECGHTIIEHNDHVDFLHNGHMHHPDEGHVDEHKLEVSSANPETCTNGRVCNGHDAQRVHGTDCGMRLSGAATTWITSSKGTCNISMRGVATTTAT
jgi:hypothetical protein